MAVKQVSDTTAGEPGADEDVIAVTPGGTSHDVVELQKTFFRSIIENPKAMIWCFYSLYICIMWGYDGLASAVVLSLPQFRQDYGEPYKGEYVLPAQWQLAFSGGSLIGLFIGGLVAGPMFNRIGRRLTILSGYSLTIAGVCCQWFSIGDLPVLFAGKLLTGIPLGIFVTVAPTYCVEIAPLRVRGAVTAAVNFAIVVGQLLAYGVERQSSSFAGPMSYRTIFAVQWGFAVVGIACLPFFPESPYYYVKKGKMDKALKSIRRLRPEGYQAEEWLETIQTNLKRENQKEEGTYLECFQNGNTQRTLVAMSIHFVQQVCGVSWVLGYMSYFFELAGMSNMNAFNLSVGLTGCMVVGCMIGWVLVERLGRRTTVLLGCAILTTTLFLIGGMASINNTAALWTTAALMAVWSIVYQATVGSGAWPIVVEVPRSSLRGHTQALATATQGCAGAIWGFALPYAVNPNEGNLGGKVGFIYGAILFVCTLGIFWYYPETKGRTFAEIDALYERGIPARKFHKTKLTLIPDEAMKDGTDEKEGTTVVHAECM